MLKTVLRSAELVLATVVAAAAGTVAEINRRGYDQLGRAWAACFMPPLRLRSASAACCVLTPRPPQANAASLVYCRLSAVAPYTIVYSRACTPTISVMHRTMRSAPSGVVSV